MNLKCLCVIPMLVSVSSFAGNSMSNQCDGDYITNVKIQAINVTSNWLEKGPAVNVRINGAWYGKYFDDNADKGFYQLAYLAHIMETSVDACVYKGNLRGLEFY